MLQRINIYSDIIDYILSCEHQKTGLCIILSCSPPSMLCLLLPTTTLSRYYPILSHSFPALLIHFSLGPAIDVPYTNHQHDLALGAVYPLLSVLWIQSKFTKLTLSWLQVLNNKKKKKKKKQNRSEEVLEKSKIQTINEWVAHMWTQHLSAEPRCTW